MVSSLDDKVATPEKGVLHRPIKMHWRGFFGSLTKGALAIGTADPTSLSSTARDLGGHMIDAATSVELGREPDELAGALLRRSMIRAVGSLLTDYWDQIDFTDDQIKQAVQRAAEHVDRDLKAMEIRLDHDLLDRPRELAILPRFVEQLERWLDGFHLRDQKASTIAARLPAYFVYGLREEARSDRYGSLFEHIGTHYAEAWRRERTWLAYEDWFRRELHRPLFTESFSLPQTFIWPRAYYIEHHKQEPSRRDFDASDARVCPERRHVVKLREHLDEWMAREDQTDAIRVISGDPGAGKSSLARMYTEHRMARGDRVIFVALHLLENPAGPLLRQVEEYLSALDDAPKGALLGDHTEKTILLVLDGLDELSKQGTAGESIAKDFVERVRTAISSRNRQSLRLRVLLSGRPIAIQDIARQVHEDEAERVLHLLPLYVPDEWKRSAAHQYVGEIDELVHDQRTEWWRRFGTFARGGYDEMPAELQSPELVELTQQPLLNYLVAVVYEDFKALGKPLDGSSSRNEIYEILLRRMFDREKQEGRAQRISNLTLATFTRLLEEMALAGWHRGERVVSFEAVTTRCKDEPRLARILDDFTKAGGGGITRLFTAFYFRRHGEQQGLREHYEFTHKSFAEYLTARRMVGVLDYICRHMQPSDDLDADQWTEAAGLFYWLKVFGPSAITHYLLPYLRKEVELRADAPVRQWQTVLVRLINATLRRGMPCEQLLGLTFHEMKRRSRNAEEALLVMLDACAAVTTAVSEITWPTPTSFGTWIKFLQGQRIDGTNAVALKSLRRIHIGRQHADFLDLFGASLDGARMEYISLEFANLNNASLKNANLFSANLKNANLIGASLTSAKLSFVSLGEANLKFADLTSANLFSADLTSANLFSANLKNTRLNNSIRDKANFSNTILETRT